MGFSFGTKYRSWIMLAATIITAISIILNVVAIVSISQDRVDIENSSWTLGISEEGNGVESKIFFGISGIVFSSGSSGTEEYISWNDVRCSNFNEDACNRCKGIATGSGTTAIIALITALLALNTDIQRSTEDGDLNCAKMKVMITGALRFFNTFYSISTWVNECNRNLPSFNAMGGKINYTAGPGLVCLITATLLIAVDVMLHILVPVPDRSSKEEIEVEKGNHTSGEKNADIKSKAEPTANGEGDPGNQSLADAKVTGRESIGHGPGAVL